MLSTIIISGKGDVNPDGEKRAVRTQALDACCQRKEDEEKKGQKFPFGRADDR
jgi:hypothetical protein